MAIPDNTRARYFDAALLILDYHIRYSGSNEHDDGEGDAEGEIANGLEGNFVTPVSVNRPPRRYIFHKQDKIPKT